MRTELKAGVARRHSGATAIVVATLLAFATDSAAQEDSSAALQAFINTPEHKAALMGSLRPYFGSLPTCHPETARRIGLVVLKPVSFEATGVLSTGAWKESVQVEGCGTSGLFNILTVAREGAPPLTGAMLPGTTHASMLLQRDALTAARSTALARLTSGCTEIHVIDTKFEGFGETVNANVPVGRDGRLWRETWTLIGCGQQATVSMQFVPDRTGTTFTAGP